MSTFIKCYLTCQDEKNLSMPFASGKNWITSSSTKWLFYFNKLQRGTKRIRSGYRMVVSTVHITWN